MFGNFAIRDLAVISSLGCILIQEPDDEVCQRQDRSNFLGLRRNYLLACVDATGAPKLKEVSSEPSLLKTVIETSVPSPHCFLETGELRAIFFSECERSHGASNAR